MFLPKRTIFICSHRDRFVIGKFSCFRSFFDIVEGKFHVSSIRRPFFSLLSTYLLHFLYPRIYHSLFRIRFCKFHPQVFFYRFFPVGMVDFIMVTLFAIMKCFQELYYFKDLFNYNL